MKTVINEISQCERELIITVDAKDAQKAYEKTLSKFKKYVNVPGFRKGKAPMSMIERIYGNHVRDEFIQEQLEIYYKEAIEKEDIKSLIPGVPQKHEWDKGNDFTATFYYEVEPKIDIKKTDGIEVEFEAMSLPGDAVEKQLEKIQIENATFEDTDEEVIKFDQANVEITYDGIEEPVKRLVIVGDSHFGDKFNDDIIGTKKDSLFKTTILLQGKEKNATVKILNTKKRKLPEINDEFVKDLGSDSLDELRKVIEKELMKEINNNNKAFKINQILDALYKENPFDLPKHFLNQYARQLAEEGASQYKMDVDKILPYYKPMAESQMKRFYFINALKEELNVEITEDDNNYVLQEAAENLNITVDDYKEKYAKELETEDFQEKVKEYKILKEIETKCIFIPIKEKNEETK